MSSNSNNISTKQIKELPYTFEDITRCTSKFQTPFHLYDEKLIREACQRLKTAFNWIEGFQNYFAVKATPNPAILKIIKEEGFGCDCCSLSELKLAEATGFTGNEEIYFTSNNTQINEFAKAKELGAIINLDDISHIHYIHDNLGLPDYISLRFNPGVFRTGNKSISDLRNSKFGMTNDQIFQGVKLAMELGVSRFALHSMMLSNCTVVDSHVEAAKMMFRLVVEVQEKLGITIEAVNLGGGIGIPYEPHQNPMDLQELGDKIKIAYEEIIVPTFGRDHLKIFYECGRYITGPAGILVTRVIHHKETYKTYLGVDASMVNLMRPSLYNAYHHMTVIPVREDETESSSKKLCNRKVVSTKDGIYDVVGNLLENNDKLATDRYLGQDVAIGDLIAIHDTGAHGHAMGFNYNGRPRSAEYLRQIDGNTIEIRRAETCEDVFSTLKWE